MSTVKDLIKDRMMSLGISPIYFVGSGLSRRYFGAPDYKGLLKEVLPNQEKLFIKLSQRWGDNYPAIAQGLAEHYFDQIDLNMLKEGIRWDFYFKNKIVEIIQEKYKYAQGASFLETHEIEWMRKTTPSAIITTNYDTFLEDIFDYDPVIGQEDILSSNLSAVGEIYKIHGCVTRPESIVVMNDDYAEFRRKKLYLNSKLMTLFLEYPIVFLGYSFGDPNVKSVLSYIVNMLKPHQVDALAERIFFIKRNETTVDCVSKERFELEDGKALYLDVYYLRDFSNLFQALVDENAQKLPLKFLRFLKNNMYKLARGQINDPKLLHVRVEDLQGIEDFSNLEIIGLTFSTEFQRVQITMTDIVDYFVHEKDHSPRATIPFLIMESKIKHVPIHFIKKTIGSLEDCITLIQGIEGLPQKDKDKFIQKLKERREVKGINSFGKTEYAFDQTDVKKLPLFIANLLHYANDYCEDHEIPVKSSSVVLRWLVLTLLKERLSEIVDNDVFMETLKDELLSCVLKLDKSFIDINKNELFIMIEKLDDRDYSAYFRNALCYLDQELYM